MLGVPFWTNFLALSSLVLGRMAGSATGKPVELNSAEPFKCTEDCIVVDHSEWSKVLKACTVPKQKRDGIEFTGFDYDKLRDTRELRESLDSYLTTLKNTETTKLSYDEGLAFMINAYNAFVVDIVVTHKPKKSIRDLSSLWFGSVFKRYKHDLTFNGDRKELSLDDVEHGYIRGKITNHKEPRVHSSVNCASVSCPDLRDEPFTGEKVEQQLDEQMKFWMGNDRKGVGIKDDHAYMSAIFKWFKKDFTNGDDTPLKVAARYAPEDVKQYIEKEDPSVRYFDYNWDLNKPQGQAAT